MASSIISVFVPGPFLEPLDYLLPEDCTAPPPVGARVLVPLRKSNVVGIVANVSQESHIPTNKLRWAIAVLDNEPLWDESHRAFLAWVASYYHAPLGEVYAMALPKQLRDGKSLSEVAIEKQKKTWESWSSPYSLTMAQEEAVRRILSSQDMFQTFLLYGITGSGKTEVYMRVIERLIRDGRQVLVLVPEIGLTPQTVQRFSERFHDKIVVSHSGLNETERLRAWCAVRNGEAAVMVGTRSAIFTPFKNLGMIIVDEEHDLSFKQQEGIRYCSRDAAIVRANILNIPVVLGSATPSLESWLNAQKQRYIFLKLPERTGCATLPTWHFIDLRQQKSEDGLSLPLIAAMKKHLAAGQQVLLFLNRRGFSPAWICPACSWAPECKACTAKLTYHTKPPRLACHHCGGHQSVMLRCLHCQTPMIPLGVGTQRLEEALEKHFKDTPVIRIDRDSTSRKRSFEKLLASIEEGNPHILVGTQMLAKGHHFPKVTMVGILYADQGLYSADFRAPEHLAQLVLQVAGRSGRAETPGEVYVQTYWPEHFLWRDLPQENGYALFAEDALQQRAFALLPPSQHMAILRAEARSTQEAESFLKEAVVKAKIYGLTDVVILGPIAALQAKRAGFYRSQVLLVSSHRQVLQTLLTKWHTALLSMKKKSTIRWHIDVDPRMIE